MSKLVRAEQLKQLFLAHVKELIREPGVLFWGIVFPILMSLGLGIAFMQKAETNRYIAIITDNSSPPDSASQLEHFLQNHTKIIHSPIKKAVEYQYTIKDDKLGNSTFHFQRMLWNEAMILLKRGNLNLILDNRNGRIHYHFDPLNPDAQLSYLKLSKLFESGNYINTEDHQSIQPLTIKGTRYIDFLIPGLMAMGAMMACMWGISYGIIDNRAKKLLRRMVATPMKKSHYLIALIMVRIGMNFVESGLLLLFAWIVFGIVIQGSISALLVMFISGNIAFAGLAILVSSHTSKTEIGNGLINLVVMPMMVLSGVFFSYHNFPEWSVPIIKYLPLTMIADGIRSIFIEGAGYAEVSLPSMILATTGILFFLAGLKIFKWH
jgi:ABC-2 type transport system permease protein